MATTVLWGASPVLAQSPGTGLTGAATVEQGFAGDLPLGATRTAAAAEPAPTNLATVADKIKAAAVVRIPAGPEVLALNDREFVLAIWRAAGDGTSVKGQALQAYFSSETNAAYTFIKTGIYAASADDAEVEIAAERAKSVRRSVATILRLDATEATPIIEQSDRDFIFAVWQIMKNADRPDRKFTAHRQAAALAAIDLGSTADEVTEFLTTGAQIAAEKDMREEILVSDEQRKKELELDQLASAKRSLLQLLQLPVTDVLVAAPNREFVLTVKDNAKGTEVKLAAQVAANAPEADLEKALHDFIFTGGSAAHGRDRAAATAAELADYKKKVEVVLDSARHDGYQPNLIAAAEKALQDSAKDANPVALQTFLLKGADAALRSDMPAPYEGMVLALKGGASGRCLGTLGVAGKDADVSGAKIVLQNCTAATTQRWVLTKSESDNWVLENVNSQMCFGVHKANPARNAAMDQSECEDGKAAQEWTFEVLPNGMYQVRNKMSSLMLGHPVGKTEVNTPAMQVQMGGVEATHQQWRLIDVNHRSGNLTQSGRIQLAGVGSKRCVTSVQPPHGITPRPGIPLIISYRAVIEDCKGEAVSLWTVTDKGDRKYELKNAQTNGCLNLDENVGAKGEEINAGVAFRGLVRCSDEPGSQWLFRPGKDGSVKLVNALTGTTVTVGGATKTVNGTALVGWSDYNGDEQQWMVTAK